MNIIFGACSAQYEVFLLAGFVVALVGIVCSILVLVRDRWSASVKGRKWRAVLFFCVIYIIAAIQLAEDFGLCTGKA